MALTLLKGDPSTAVGHHELLKTPNALPLTNVQSRNVIKLHPRTIQNYAHYGCQSREKCVCPQIGEYAHYIGVNIIYITPRTDDVNHHKNDAPLDAMHSQLNKPTDVCFLHQILNIYNKL